MSDRSADFYLKVTVSVCIVFMYIYDMVLVSKASKLPSSNLNISVFSK